MGGHGVSTFSRVPFGVTMQHLLTATFLCLHPLLSTAVHGSPHPQPAASPSKFGVGYGLRPTPSHDLPVVDLIESPDKMYDPKTGDLDPQILEKKLGHHYDPRFMSVKRPMDFSPQLSGSNGSMALQPQDLYGRTKKGMLVPVGKMPKEIRKLKFKFVHLPDGRKIRTKVTSRLRRKLRQFLWAYTYCPVMYVWKDLGSRFWPRYLREGKCFAGPAGPSCSFPPGQTCKPNKSVNKLILRWYCQDWDRARFCKWISVRYPVITSCSCSC